MWDALKLIYEDSQSIKHEKMNTQGKKDNLGYFKIYKYQKVCWKLC